MRIHVKIRSNHAIIPYSHQHLLTGVIHKWFGWNKLHGNLSLYSFSRLKGVTNIKGGLQTDTYCNFFISAFDKELIHSIVKGAYNDPTMFCGLIVEEISIEEEPEMNDRDYFYAASPILVKRLTDHGMKHYIYSDEETDAMLKETLLTKMKQVGLEDETLEIHFDRSYLRASTKLIDYKGVKNRVSLCPIIIKGTPETKKFVWNVGLGNSTGVGFGAIE